MTEFKDFSLPDLLRAIRYCQKNYEENDNCYNCYYYKRAICNGKREDNKFLNAVYIRNEKEV